MIVLGINAYRGDAPACLVSPFDEAEAVSVDGFGDFASAGWGVGRGRTVEVEGRAYFPHSLGFPSYGDEYKVMGLAPCGEPAFLPQLRKVVRLREGRGGCVRRQSPTLTERE